MDGVVLEIGLGQPAAKGGWRRTGSGNLTASEANHVIDAHELDNVFKRREMPRSTLGAQVMGEVNGLRKPRGILAFSHGFDYY